MFFSSLKDLGSVFLTKYLNPHSQSECRLRVNKNATCWISYPRLDFNTHNLASKRNADLMWPVIQEFPNTTVLGLI
jgi:hypothetical protein